MFTFLVIKDAEEWVCALRSFVAHDFVHTYDFHRISEFNQEGSPVLFLLRDNSGGSIICWPALARPIPATGLFDLGCVYGYGGPLVAKGLSEQQMLAAFECIFDRMKKAGYVSLFSRMHPLFLQSLPDEIKGVALGDVVVIDASPNQKNFLEAYRSAHRYEIRKAERMGVSVVVDESCAELSDFVEIYQQAMRDLQAADYYIFDKNYFKQMVNAKDFKTIIIFAVYEGKKVAASMFVVRGNIMQYYLSGSVAEFKKLAASKLIIAKAHELARDWGVSEVILGGGVGSKQDALFDFKKGFSSRTEKFSVFKKILNPQIYETLCVQKGISSGADGFFPAYRAALS